MSSNKRIRSLNNMSPNKKIGVESNKKSPFENLPPEVLDQIFGELPIVDLCNVVSTSRHLRNVGSASTLWSKMNVNKEKLVSEGLRNLLSIERFKKLQQLDLSDLHMDSTKWEKLLRDICSSQIKDLDMSRLDLTTLGNSLFNIVPGLNKLNISETCINTHQVESILSSIISSNKFEDLNLEYVDISEVKPDLLAQAVSVLKKVNLKETFLPVDSCIELFEKCLDSSHLRHVNFEGIDLQSVPSSLIAEFVSKLQSVSFQNSTLTPDQRSELTKVVKSSKYLRDDETLMMTLLGFPVSFTGTNTTYHTFGWFFHEENDCQFVEDRNCVNGYCR